MNPKFCIASCPICGGGLCGIRVCTTDPGSPDEAGEETSQDAGGRLHGFVICDECEAIWMEPDVTTAHRYPSAIDPKCPITGQDLWGPQGRWADWEDLQALGWEAAIDPALSAVEVEGDESA